jgi:hypothetical protein
VVHAGMVHFLQFGNCLDSVTSGIKLVAFKKYKNTLTN